ncbi:hypothetical protein A0H81_12450 [Grifola frondosa]|uniref:F-box domain-containing protein n=1 Tax=Grifola frondosa TaxID=5627 RepID=A0A1C7LTC6_GRIFR|nr:hypothetical protein A0H81_12450 [Grifola frondosa]
MTTGSQDAASWPCLEELDIAPPDISSQYIMAEANNVISWEVPRLKRLIVSADLQHLDKFLERHGSNLIFLDIRNARFPNFDGLELTPILSQLRRLCPDLRHLVFAPNSTGLHCLDEIPLHSSLRYVDIWVTNLDIEACTKTLVDFMASRAIVVRALDSRLIHIRSLPRLLSPTTPSNELPATHNLLGFFIEHKKSCIWLLEGNWPDEQDSQYVEFDSDESVGDSASSNMSDGSSNSGFQLDRQTALAAYRANLETDPDGSDDQSGSNEESPNDDTLSMLGDLVIY